jgi:hypothetical protein
MRKTQIPGGEARLGKPDGTGWKELGGKSFALGTRAITIRAGANEPIEGDGLGAGEAVQQL